jgi:FkbH-like protein
MKLRLDDIAVFRANWNNKVDNIRDIAATLNIGLDSLVFVDDNPAERAIVRQFLPMVEVPELPEDPAGYIAALAEGAYFETTAFSDEDRARARMYRENAQRSELQMSFKDTASYLTSLDMTGDAGALDSFQLARMAQLINKSNQFHLTTTRYPEAELQALAARPDHAVRHFKLRDRFGDNGLISVIILRQEGRALVIDTWVMSCRVLARTMEEFILNEMIAVARARGCGEIIGLYKPTAKNKLVAGLYEKLGFEKVGDEGGVTRWRLKVAPDTDRISYVRQTQMEAAC